MLSFHFIVHRTFVIFVLLPQSCHADLWNPRWVVTWLRQWLSSTCDHLSNSIPKKSGLSACRSVNRSASRKPRPFKTIVMWLRLCDVCQSRLCLFADESAHWLLVLLRPLGSTRFLWPSLISRFLIGAIFLCPSNSLNVSHRVFVNTPFFVLFFFC